MSVLNYLKYLNKSQYFSSCQLLRICEIFIIYCSDKLKKIFDTQYSGHQKSVHVMLLEFAKFQVKS
jgi:hypothetical protein